MNCWRQRARLFLLSLLLFANSCADPAPPAAFVPVRVATLRDEEIVQSRRFSGSIEPLQTTSLAFKLAGTVQSLHRPPGHERDVQVGDTLTKGTVIAELEEGDLRRAKLSAEAKVAQLQARVATARDNLSIATRNFERFVNSAGSVSKVARDDADARRVSAAGELAAAEHALADAQVQLDQATDDYANRQLIVPFEQATVAEKRIERGERVQSGVPVFKLIDISTVHVRFGVPDTMVGDVNIGGSGEDKVMLGQRLRIVADAFSGRALEATVTKIAQADPQTRTFMTELTLANPVLPDGQRLLKPGMIVTVVVGADRDRELMLIPLRAVHRGSSPDELIAYEAVVENGREVARARKVMLGGVYNNAAELVPAASELRAGARVIVTTGERPFDSALVRIMEDNAASPATLPEAK